MLKIKFLYGCIILCSTTPVFAELLKLSVNDQVMKVVDQCDSKNGTNVIFIKQWHLLPSVNTKETKAPISKAGKKYKEYGAISKAISIPQEKNQVAIYQQISQWINGSNAQLLLAEGCQAGTEIDSNFKPAFNGWTVTDLQKESTSKDFERIMTHIALKLEAKFGKKIQTLCADDETLIKQSQLALSDARADASYLSRLKQFMNDPERAKTYLDGAIESYQLPKTATVADAILKIKNTLKEDIQKFKSISDQRSLKLVEFISKKQKDTPDSRFVVVFGGMHASKVKTALNEAKLGCEILEPSGYEQNEEKLLATLGEALK